MVTVKFTPNLKRFFPDLEPFQAEGKTLLEVINEIDKVYPGIKGYICDDQEEIRQHVQVFIGENMLHDRRNLSEKKINASEMYIMQALSGG